MVQAPSQFTRKIIAANRDQMGGNDRLRHEMFSLRRVTTCSACARSLSESAILSDMTKYSLVLQFPANDIEDYDRLIEIEDALTKYLHGLADVDGHDSGSGEMNIFIFTDKPEETFDKAKVIIKAAGMLTSLSAAYRLTTGEEYSRLWPVSTTEPFTVV